MTDYITVKEAAQTLGTSEEFIRRAVRSGILENERSDATRWAPYLIPRKAFDEWAARRVDDFVFQDIEGPSFNESERRLIDLGWLGGILDGEGHIGIVRQRWKKSWGDKQGFYVGAVPLVQVAMTDSVCVRKCFEIAGVGDFSTKRSNHAGRKKPVCVWRAASNDAARVLSIVIHFLIGKRRQAELVIRVCQLNYSYRHGLRGQGGGRRPEDTEEIEVIGDELFKLQGRRPFRFDSQNNGD